MITAEDVVLAISYSGESEEIQRVLPIIKRRGAKVIAITGRAQSTLAKEADVHLDAAVEKEACPLNLAPTASTTASLALGDALAVALLEARGFKTDDFALHHPGGALGRLGTWPTFFAPATRCRGAPPATCCPRRSSR
jgi:arabinose-5-phosphate isomerase